MFNKSFWMTNAVSSFSVPTAGQDAAYPMLEKVLEMMASAGRRLGSSTLLYKAIAQSI